MEQVGGVKYSFLVLFRPSFARILWFFTYLIKCVPVTKVEIKQLTGTKLELFYRSDSDGFPTKLLAEIRVPDTSVVPTLSKNYRYGLHNKTGSLVLTESLYPSSD